MSARSKRSQRYSGSTGIVSQLLGAILNKDSTLQQNPDFGKQPGDVDFTYKGDPSEKVKTKYTDKGGGPLGTKFGKEAEFERLTGIDAADTELSKNKALLQFTSELQEQIRKAKLNEEGLLTSAAYDASVGGRKPGVLSELSPIGDTGNVDILSPYSNEYRGQILGKIPGIVASESAMAGDRLKMQQAQQQQGREAAPEFQEAKKKNEIGLLLKALDRPVGPNQMLYGGDDSIYAGMTEQQEIIPGPITFQDPKTGMKIQGDPTKITKTMPGRRILPEKSILDAIDAGGQQPSSQITDDAPSSMLGGGILGGVEGVNDDASLLKTLDQQVKEREKLKQRKLMDQLLLQLRR